MLEGKLISNQRFFDPSFLPRNCMKLKVTRNVLEEIKVPYKKLNEY